LGHKRELGGKRGRYPKKECALVKTLLRNAVANASHKGLDEKRLFVRHAAAFKQNSFSRYRKFWASSATLGYGKRAVWSNYETARCELVVEEREVKEKKKKEKKEQKEKKPAKPAEKAAEAKVEPKPEEKGAGAGAGAGVNQT
jgi:hypothetical protein